MDGPDPSGRVMTISWLGVLLHVGDGAACWFSRFRYEQVTGFIYSRGLRRAKCFRRSSGDHIAGDNSVNVEQWRNASDGSHSVEDELRERRALAAHWLQHSIGPRSTMTARWRE